MASIELFIIYNDDKRA